MIYKIDDNELIEIINKFPDILKLDAKIVYMRENKSSYHWIQLRLGNPSKKYIKHVLLKYAPELIDITPY